MDITLLAPLWGKTPPKKYDSSELVVANLAEGLAKLAHKLF